ncbi:hypothetical protein ACQR5V_21595 [Xanthomonas oryzae pv. oryzicola]|uniref:hypothetical protein n=1 Tax=Xanthomonas oryzae TaxID=347 RepID=UPI0005CDE859|nr:hypothetical protein [Xanthomonas oryzae]AJQ88083.1 hypothetical protein BE73_14270 [Xanthomonas oryzae pv. oryzicola]AVU02473.1 hypothetical protein C0L90_08430 [Xanthomonas oryzae pv. oryzae]OWB26828.1 hypothetical protein XocBAI21_17355 [Xanthomonas oryzae pv. oryzicola]QBI15671.1 hypothetical protein EYR03_08480 [Xanthomonas oryzae pv. oryzae]QBI15729.1 hypothetical protein EYR03_08800 [Xanthomonas oryzae pv. oryzae]
MSGLNALAVLDSQIAELRASRDTGNVENLLWLRDALAEVLESGWPLVEYQHPKTVEIDRHRAALIRCGSQP